MRLPYRTDRRWWQFWKPRTGMEFREIDWTLNEPYNGGGKIKEPRP